MTTLKALWVALACAATLGVVQAQGLRPEVGKPLQQASDLLKAGKAKEALAKAREADAVSGKTAAEQLTIDRMKGAAAQRAGDNASAIQAYEAVFPKLQGAEAGQVAESLAFAYSANKDWPRTHQWIQKAQGLGNTSAQLKQLQAYAQGQSGDFAAVARDAAAAITAAEGASRRPDEGDLLRLADAQLRTGNPNGQAATLEKLLYNYPKKDYWGIYLNRLERRPGFSPRFALDVMRLKLATGNLSKTEDFVEMAQLAIQAGYPAEGKAIIDKGFDAKALGVGAEADRHKRLRDLASNKLAESKAGIDARAVASGTDGNDLVQLGYAYVTLGQADKGISLIEQAIAKGGLKRPDDAKLRLGLALLQAGKKAKASQTLRGVQGQDGSADIGKLWALQGGA